MHACTEKGRDFRNNYYKTIIQTDVYDCTYVYTCCGIIRRHGSDIYLGMPPIQNFSSYLIY